MRRVLVMNQYFSPDKTATAHLLSDLCKGLADKGIQVSVVCNYPNYTDDLIPAPGYEVDGNLEVCRVGLKAVRGRKNMAIRVTGYLGYLAGACLKALVMLRRCPFDAVMTVSNPPMIGAVGAWLAGAFHIPFVYVLHDLHPDVLLLSGKGDKLPGAAIKAWVGMNRYIFGKAERVVVLGDCMKARIQAKGVGEERITVIHNWAHPELGVREKMNPFRRSLRLDEDCLLVLYSGNHGISHNLEWLVDAAEAMYGKPVHFLFVGDGAKKPGLVRMVRDRNVTNVSFMDYLSAEDYELAVAAADFGVVAMEPGLEGYAVPSKVYGILAAGRPVLALMKKESDIGMVIEQYDCGLVCESGQEVNDALAMALGDRGALTRMGANARIVYEGRFSLDRAVGEYRDLIMGLG